MFLVLPYWNISIRTYTCFGVIYSTLQRWVDLDKEWCGVFIWYPRNLQHGTKQVCPSRHWNLVVILAEWNIRAPFKKLSRMSKHDDMCQHFFILGLKPKGTPLEWYPELVGCRQVPNNPTLRPLAYSHLECDLWSVELYHYYYVWGVRITHVSVESVQASSRRGSYWKSALSYHTLRIGLLLTAASDTLLRVTTFSSRFLVLDRKEELFSAVFMVCIQ